jgi:HSP20 family protein
MLVLRNSNQVPSLFDRFLMVIYSIGQTAIFQTHNTTIPSVNIKENSDAFTVEVAAARVSKKAILKLNSI